MGIFKGFLQLERKFINYRKIPYFIIRFGGNLGEDLGERLPPIIIGYHIKNMD